MRCRENRTRNSYASLRLHVDARVVICMAEVSGNYVSGCTRAPRKQPVPPAPRKQPVPPAPRGPSLLKRQFCSQRRGGTGNWCLGSPPPASSPRPRCSVGKLKRKEGEFSYTHLHRLIPGVRQSLLPPTHRRCCEALALEPLHPCPPCAAGRRNHHKPSLIALTGTCQKEGDGRSPWGTSQGHAGTEFVSTGALKCGCS